MDIQIAGDIGRRRPVREIRERIYAKTLALEYGGEQFCILSVEVCYITHKWIDEIRRRIAARFGINPKAVMIHSIQNHSAPAVGNAAVSDEYEGIPADLWWLRSSDKRYNPVAAAGIVEAVGKAQARLEPVTARFARTVDGRVAFNRRFVLRDGTAIAHPHGDKARQILHCEGPTAPEVGMLLQNQSGRNVAALLHHTCHPVHGYPKLFISADCPGAWASAMRSTLGADCVALVINGCCGNIHHHNHLDPSHVDSYLRMGGMLAETTSRALQSLEPAETPCLAWCSEQLRLPLRQVPKQEVEAARRLLAEKPQPPMLPEPLPSIEWDWVYAHSVLDFAVTSARQPYYDYEVQAVRIANNAIVALTGKPFVEGQLRMKLESPIKRLMVAHMSNGYIGYVPTPEALRRGGPHSFETRTSNWSKLAPNALDQIVDKALSLLKELAD